jgi:hypothetical protein
MTISPTLQRLASNTAAIGACWSKLMVAPPGAPRARSGQPRSWLPSWIWRSVAGRCVGAPPDRKAAAAPARPKWNASACSAGWTRWPIAEA